MSDPLIIIPARLDSTRLPGKMLRPIGEKRLIEWTWIAAMRCGLPVLIATDSEAIATEANRFGARVVLTGEAENGTERCKLALDRISERPDLVVNWQGDSPLTPPFVVRELLSALSDPDQIFDVTTPIFRINPPDQPGAGQCIAVLGPGRRALYFSRAALPPQGPWWGHFGIYAYRRSALDRYGTTAHPLELAEKLEQLRWLEMGMRVGCVPIACGPIPEVNELSDIRRVEMEL